MKAKYLLRCAAIIMGLHTIGHTIGALSWANAPNTAVAKVIEGMQNNHFDFMGRSSSLAGFYAGYGYSMIGMLLLISIVLWLLSNDTASALSRQLRLATGLFLLFLAIVEYIWFFPFAAALSLLAGLCTVVSLRFVGEKK